jgi:hypothetical protein
MNRPLPLVRVLLLALSTCALTACLERKETGILNPDGSGKAVVDTLLPLPPTQPGSPKPDTAMMGKAVASQIIGRAKGVDAWKDLVVDTAPDGRIHVAATAYFPDISKFRLDSPFSTSWTKNADGTYTFAIQKDQPADAPPPPPMTDDQVAQAITSAKMDYKQNQPAMQTVLNALKIDTTFTLPGTVSATNIFTKAPDSNTVTLVIDGKAMIAAMDKIMTDDKLLATAVRAGNNSPVADELLIENIFGKKGPISATVTGAVKAQFDYKAESDAAKAAQAAMFAKVGVNPVAVPMAPEMAPGGTP